MQDEQNTVLDETQEQLQQQEPLLTQSKVNHIIKQEKEKAFAKGIEHASKTNQLPVGEDIDKHIADKVNSRLQAELENLAKKAEEERRKSMEEEFKGYMNKAYNNIKQNIDAVKDKHNDYDDIKDVLGTILDRMPEVVLQANEFENSADMLLELARHPTKAKLIKDLSREKEDLPLAKKALESLSKSLKINENASSMKNSFKPISNINPSSIGSKSDGSVKDWSKHFYG